MQIIDLLAHGGGDGRFTALTDDGRVFELAYDGHRHRRVWKSLDAPFVAIKLAMRPDGVTFAVANDGALWQRMPDDREFVPSDGRIGSTTTFRPIPKWQQLAGPPPADL